MPPIPGVDVAKWQDGMSWDAVKAAGKLFAGVKVTDGAGGVDPDGQDFRGKCEAEGMPCILYHFVRFGDSPLLQAQNVVRAVGKLRKGESIALDVEWDTRSPKYGMRDATMDAAAYQLVLTIADQVRKGLGLAPGFRFFLYTNPYFWAGKDRAPAAFANFLYWAAGYVSDVSKVQVPAPFTGISIWQYSENVVVQNIGKGITGVDGDYFYGTQADLFALCQQ